MISLTIQNLRKFSVHLAVSTAHNGIVSYIFRSFIIFSNNQKDDIRIIIRKLLPHAVRLVQKTDAQALFYVFNVEWGLLIYIVIEPVSEK